MLFNKQFFYSHNCDNEVLKNRRVRPAVIFLDTLVLHDELKVKIVFYVS